MNDNNYGRSDKEKEERRRRGKRDGDVRSSRRMLKSIRRPKVFCV